MNENEEIAIDDPKKLISYISLNENFLKWIGQMSEKYNVDRSDIKTIIKQYLM